MSWTWLEAVNRELFGNDPFSVAFDCFSVFADTKGILIVIGDREIASIKFAVDTNNKPCNKQPLAAVTDCVRIKGIQGTSVAQDSRSTIILTKDKRMFAFKSFKKIVELTKYTNVKLLQCFKDSCYILVTQTQCDVKLQLFTSFGEGDDSPIHEFDLSLPRDPCCGSRDNEQMCVEFIEGPLSETDRIFLAELLACDFEQESIFDVLLVSIDEKLFWIKFSESFRETDVKSIAIDLITSAKGTIRGLKFCDESLLLLDDFNLSIIYLCPAIKAIKKKEIPIIGTLKCFRFHNNQFMYSNLNGIYFIDIVNHCATVRSIDLKGIVCFTVVENLGFIIAICCNQMFYYVQMKDYRELKQNSEKLHFKDLQVADIEMIPSVAKFIDGEEAKLLKIERKAKELQRLKILLLHQTKIKDFIAGEASVVFHQTLPAISESSIVCKVTDQKIGSEFIELRISLSKMLKDFTLAIAFHRQSATNAASKIVRIPNAGDLVHVLMPAEPIDNANNKMSLEIVFNYVIKGQTRLIVFPIAINQIIPFDGPRMKCKSSIEECLNIIREMKS